MGITLHVPIVEWNKENVVKFILQCRDQHGTPIFRTKFAGERLKTYENKPAVLGICFSGTEEEISRAFADVPSGIVDWLEYGTSDWKRILERYAPEKLPRQRYRPTMEAFRIFGTQ